MLVLAQESVSNIGYATLKSLRTHASLSGLSADGRNTEVSGALCWCSRVAQIGGVVVIASQWRPAPH